MNTKLKVFTLCLLTLVFVITGYSEAAAAEVFHSLAVKTGMFAKGLRYLAYVISGFGIIMFTFMAIFGKINFKHLGYIMISLFFLSGMGALITYIKGGDSTLVYEFNDTYIKAVPVGKGGG